MSYNLSTALQDLFLEYYTKNFGAVAHELLQMSKDVTPEDMESLAEEKTAFLEVNHPDTIKTLQMSMLATPRLFIQEKPLTPPA